MMKMIVADPALCVKMAAVVVARPESVLRHVLHIQPLREQIQLRIVFATRVLVDAQTAAVLWRVQDP